MSLVLVADDEPAVLEVLDHLAEHLEHRGLVVRDQDQAHPSSSHGARPGAPLARDYSAGRGTV